MQGDDSPEKQGPHGDSGSTLTSLSLSPHVPALCLLLFSGRPGLHPATNSDSFGAMLFNLSEPQFDQLENGGENSTSVAGFLQGEKLGCKQSFGRDLEHSEPLVAYGRAFSRPPFP